MVRIIIISTMIALVIASCKRKEYVCECTDKTTGEKRYGDTFKGELQRRAAQESCDKMVNEFDTTDVCRLITK